MNILANLSVADLRKVIVIKEKIEELSAELDALGGTDSEPTTQKQRGPKTMSAAARAKIGAAQKLRWAKSRGTKEEAVPKKRRKMSAAGRAKIAAAAKARWAKAKAAGKSSL